VKHRNTGILVEPHNPADLKVALEELIRNKSKREKFGSNGQEWVLQRFEADKVAGQIAGIYRKVIG
jgi:glycosyltransferase involved in cell wall biosynthesis